MNTIITLCSALLSGILATVVTLVVTHLQQKKSQKHEYKLQIFKDVVAYLTDITDNGVSTGNFQKAINQVFIAYNGCTDVINKFEIFRLKLWLTNCLLTTVFLTMTCLCILYR